ncbi:sialoadhesin-like isoform X4 [Mobula birostris]|uniref:sialoadhesin-like isoform X4 n=2 Tax=Mobula birostris TaxID=1983395 RepID=UPI003B285C85
MMMKTILLLLLSILQGVAYSWWMVRTPQIIMASDGSCVQIPCIFSHPANYPLAEVKWLKDNKTHGTLVIDSKKQSDPQFHQRAQLYPQWEAEKDCTLTITSVSHRDVGRYYFRMEDNSGGKYSGPDGVLVNVSDVSNLPIISSPEEIIEGREVTLTCSVKYGCPGHLTWTGSDGLADQTSTEPQRTDQNIATTSLTLSFVASYQDHGRILSCEQTSSPGKLPSQTITLNVKYAPRFAHLTISPFKTIGLRESVTLECVVGDSNPPVTSYSWYRSSSTNSRREETSSGTRQIYSTDRDTEYRCEAVNSLGKATSERTKLPVYGSYNWAVWTPLSLHAREGSCVIIPCLFHIPATRTRYTTATGIWFKDVNYEGTPVYHTPSGIGGNYTGRVEFLGHMESENCSLKIRNLKESDGGKYYFRIETSSGKWSDPIGFTLLVSRSLDKPVIKVPERVVEGEAVSLTCSVHTYCPEDNPVFEWHLPGFNVPQLTGKVSQVFQDYHWIYSHTVVYTPTLENSHQAVKCAANFGPQTPSRETEISLDVKNPPRNVTISLSVNWRTDTQNIKEGDRVVLNCNSAPAHPAVNEYTWYKGGTELWRQRSGSLQFSPISHTDFGTYVCQASNEVGRSRSAEFTVTGKTRPLDVHIEYHVNGIQIKEQAVMRENDRLTLTCVSTKSDPPVSSYSWLQNGRTEKSQNQELQFDRINREEDGKRYQCQAHNEIGTRSSETITIHVQYAPTNVRITSPAAAPVGQSITLWCKSDANPEPHNYNYSWRKVCGSSLVNLQCYSRDCRLWITRADISCDYYCTVRNSIGEGESPPKRIIVQYAPTNVHITSPDAAPVGQYITLSCESEANPAANYFSWRKVCGSQSRNLWRNSGKYGLNVQMEDASCDYHCSARNSIGEQESPGKRIDVQYKPEDVKILSSDSVVEGSQVLLRCESVGNPPADTYQWKKVCSGMEMRLEGSTHELQIQVSTEDESCAYYCRAGNVIGDQESEPKRFKVRYGPRDTKIKSSESSGRIREGKSLTLTCESRARPDPQFSWYRGPGTTQAVPSGDRQLTFNPLSSSDSGNYSCGASNGIGSGRSPFFLLDVLYGPRKTKISASAPPEQVQEGDNITLSCQSDSNPPISSYQWLWSNGVTNATVASTSNCLHLVRISQQQDGVYYCLVTADSRSQVSEGISIRVSWSYRKKVTITITTITIIIILIVIIIGILYFRHLSRKKRLESFRQWSTDATNVVYSVVNKPKPKETLVYENMVLTENARSNGQSTPEEGIHASVTFQHGSHHNASDSYTELAWPSGSKSTKTKIQGEPNVVYSHVRVRPHKAKDSEDYENVGHLGSLDQDESDEEISYTTVVLPQPSRTGPIRRPSEDSIEYTNLVT